MVHQFDFQDILGKVKKFRSQSPFDTKNGPKHHYQNRTVHNDYTWMLSNSAGDIFGMVSSRDP